jgi:acyl carrier protein
MTQITVQQAVYDYLHEIFPTVDVNLQSTLIDDLGLDSLDIVEMIMMVEEKLNIVIKDTNPVTQSSTVGSLIEEICAKHNVN